MIVLVTSRDGITFRVNTQPRSAPSDRAYAAARFAAELEQHGDFHRVNSLDDLVEPGETIVIDEVAPFRTKPALTLIRGGRYHDPR